MMWGQEFRQEFRQALGTYLHALGLHAWEDFEIDDWWHRRCAMCGRTQQYIPDCGAPGHKGSWADVDLDWKP